MRRSIWRKDEGKNDDRTAKSHARNLKPVDVDIPQTTSQKNKIPLERTEPICYNYDVAVGSFPAMGIIEVEIERPYMGVGDRPAQRNRQMPKRLTDRDI